ncbi:hypothetical protein, partial [Segatella oulorum]
GTNRNITYIHIHPTNAISDKANYTREVHVMTEKELNKLKKNIKGFIAEFSKYDLKNLTEDFISKALETHKLTSKDIRECYWVDPKHHLG